MKDCRTEIAITKDGEDYIRIIPRLKDGNQLELVFMFLCFFLVYLPIIIKMR